MLFDWSVPPRPMPLLPGDDLTEASPPVREIRVAVQADDAPGLDVRSLWIVPRAVQVHGHATSTGIIVGRPSDRPGCRRRYPGLVRAGPRRSGPGPDQAHLPPDHRIRLLQEAMPVARRASGPAAASRCPCGIRTGALNTERRRSRGGVQFPTGGVCFGRVSVPRHQPASARRVWRGQQIRCDPGADGRVRMEEDASVQGLSRGGRGVRARLRPGSRPVDGIRSSMNAASSLLQIGLDRTELPLPVARGFREALAAACAHLGATAPNPPVGCAVLDRDGRVLVAAGHERAGRPHAEALALSRLADAGRLAEAHTLLVTLEPCNHQGRTGPCTEAILQSPVRTVWIGCPDPNPHVGGHGADRLREGGLVVHLLGTGPDREEARLHRDCRALIAPFRRWATGGRPWITVKQALDSGNGMVPPPGARTFTDDASLRLAHRLRRATDAVVTGAGTVRADRPHLTVRHLPDHPDRRRLLAVLGRSLPDGYADAAAARGFDLRLLPTLDQLLPALGEAGVLWAAVEAGPRLLDALREAGLWDDWLSIRHPVAGPDRWSMTLAPDHDVSPLFLLPELRGLEPDGEDACSRAS